MVVSMQDLSVAVPAGLTEFQIEVGVRRAPVNEPWEPSTKD